MNHVRALLVFIVAAGCAAPPPLSMERPSGAWILERLAGAPNGSLQKPTITFDGDHVSGFAGCNRYFGQRATDPNVATYFSGVGATRMACVGPAMELEQVFLAGLDRTRDARVVNGLLVLFDADDHEIMRFAPGAGAEQKRDAP
jgi:heat shock protein HslJ